MLELYTLLLFAPFIAYAIFKVRLATKSHHELTKQLLELNKSIDLKLDKVLGKAHVN